MKGIGPDRAKALQKLGIETVEDLLFHVPMRYEDRRRFSRIADLREGMKVAVTGEVAVAGLRRGRRMSLFEIRLEDESGRLKAIFFNQPFLREVLPRGTRVVLFGLVDRDRKARGELMMASPQFEVLDLDEEGIHTGRIVPVYEKLGPLVGKSLRRILTNLVRQIAEPMADIVPEDVRRRLSMAERGAAFRAIHDPAADADLPLLQAARDPGHVRFILEEFFLFQAGLSLRRRGLRGARKGVAFQISDAARDAVKRILPFRLTGAQRRVLKEIADDMGSEHPMNRLVQGDVGSGKTVVALLSMVVALENGYQAAFMAPTEILAEQHFLTFRRLLARCPYEVALVTSALKGRERASISEGLESGRYGIAVGTHALIQEGVRFKRLGLAVIDEQHRFGVLQREDLSRKGYEADVLVMTATPIPRTLALTVYGDLEVSTLDERPPGRTPVRTILKGASERFRIVEMVSREVAAGGQAYVVYPLVEESEKLEDVKAAVKMAEEWRSLLPGCEIGLLHGRMKAPEKEEVMSAFAAGATSILVSTTVVEVGVDVPNATVMVIEHAERFGLSQLHQLRGRVGRGQKPSTCILLTHGRLSEVARARLEVLTATEDGFAIAEKDLELRGPGDFFGTRQWGMPGFRVSHLIRDRELLERARKEALRWEQEPPGRAPALEAFLGGGGWQRRFGLSRVG